MTITTARHLRSGRGSDRSLTSLLRMVDPTRPGGCEARGVKPLRSTSAAAEREGPLRGAAVQRPLRVLLTTDWWEPAVNGVVASVATRRRELIALGCEVRVLTLSPGIRARSEQGGYRIGSGPAGMVYDSARIGMPAGRRVLGEILRWRPDVVHSQCEFSTYRWARRISRTLDRSEEHTSELQSRGHLVCRLLLEKKKQYIHEIL